MHRLLLPILPLVLAIAGATAQPAPPPDPAAAPPRPPVLATRPPSRAAPAALAAAPLIALESLPDGSWRAGFAAHAEQPSLAVQASLAELGRRLAALPTGRITVIVQASGPAKDVSAARRLTLARAEAVKRALVNGGLDATRIDLRPLGLTAAAIDVADVQPPPGPAG